MLIEEIKNIINKSESNFWKIIKYKDPNLYQFIQKTIEGRSFSEKLYKHIYNKFGVCRECGKLTSFIGINDGYRQFCSIQCRNRNLDINNKIKQSIINKYGVDNISKNNNIKLKKRDTFISKYGVGSSVEIETIKNKAKIGCVEYINNNKNIILNNLNKDKKRLFIEHCNNGSRLGDTIEPLFDINTFTNIKDNTLMFRCKTCGNIFHHHLQWGVKPICWKCNPDSELQCDIYNFITSLINLEIKPNVRDIIDGEIDIYIPSLKIGIECNGDYWHSCDKKDKLYHINKTKQCELLGIKLVHVFENEWFTSNNIKNIIKYIITGNVNDIFDFYKTNDEIYTIDRRIFNKCFFINEYNIIEETQPIKCNFGKFTAWNCGFLKLKRK